MAQLQEEKDNLFVLEFENHVWTFHQNMGSLKKENQVEDLDCWKKRKHWTWFRVFEFEMLAVDLGILPSAGDAEMMLEL